MDTKFQKQALDLSASIELPLTGPFPLTASQAAETYKLGPLLTVHSKKTKASRYIISGILAIIILLFAVFITWIVSVSFDSLKTTGIWLELEIILIYALGIYSCASTYRTYVNSKSAVFVAMNGMLYQNRKGIQAIHWSNITKIFFWNTHIPEKNNSSIGLITIRMPRRQKYTFDYHFDAFHHLHRSIERAVAQHQMPMLLKRYAAGETLEFGKLSISQQGLRKGKYLLPWDAITQVRVYSGMVTIDEDGSPVRWPLVPVSKIPNFFAFITLLHYGAHKSVTYLKASSPENPAEI